MNTPTTYAPQRADQMRAELDIVFASYRKATGFSATFCTTVACGDPKFFRSFREKDFRVGTFDKVMGRMSAVWPEGWAWPEGVARPAPIEPGPEIREEIAARLTKGDQ